LLQSNLSGQDLPDHLERLDGAFDKWLNKFDLKPSVRFGMESAVLQLLSCARNSSVRKTISSTRNSSVHVTGLLSGTEEQAVRQAKLLLKEGFEDFKLKVGGDVNGDADKVKAVNNVIYGKAVLHVDANRSWDFKEALDFAEIIGCAAVTYIEEPFKDLRKIPEFFDQTMIPVALDESLQYLLIDDVKSIAGVEKIVLKPAILGGIEKTRQMIQQAEGHAIETVISSSFESSLGIRMLANLTGFSQHANMAGLDTLKWFKTDILKQPVSFENGIMQPSVKNIQAEDINFDLLKKIIGV